MRRYPKVTDESSPIFGIPCTVKFESSTANMAIYDPIKLELIIVFNNKSRYAYDKFSNEVWIEFLCAESKGNFINRHIKNSYDYKKLTEEIN